MLRVSREGPGWNLWASKAEEMVSTGGQQSALPSSPQCLHSSAAGICPRVRLSKGRCWGSRCYGFCPGPSACLLPFPQFCPLLAEVFKLGQMEAEATGWEPRQCLVHMWSAGCPQAPGHCLGSQEGKGELLRACALRPQACIHTSGRR